jgi:MoaA/NifB/PqqE/SkfB family radical SAM enzyme
MKPYLNGIRYILERRLFNSDTPLICGLVLHNRCNFRCLHCRVHTRRTSPMSFHECTTVIDSFYREGGRTLYLEGGEPFLWRDHHHTTEDIIFYARRKGFHSVIIYTNGTIPLDSSANTLFISVDGHRESHDHLRGRSFDLIMQHIAQSGHPSIYINYTINNHNKKEIGDLSRKL